MALTSSQIKLMLIGAKNRLTIGDKDVQNHMSTLNQCAHIFPLLFTKTPEDFVTAVENLQYRGTKLSDETTRKHISRTRNMLSVLTDNEKHQLMPDLHGRELVDHFEHVHHLLKNMTPEKKARMEEKILTQVMTEKQDRNYVPWQQIEKVVKDALSKLSADNVIRYQFIVAIGIMVFGSICLRGDIGVVSIENDKDARGKLIVGHSSCWL
ncbi:hypothetical protein HKX48_002765 [Thoreauomyces humboldtii]|nr:hypothetical protein HKX48_002765 [Thoreauomyces humboldtii]